jgi:hypothetical protein
LREPATAGSALALASPVLIISTICGIEKACASRMDSVQPSQDAASSAAHVVELEGLL